MRKPSLTRLYSAITASRLGLELRADRTSSISRTAAGRGADVSPGKSVRLPQKRRRTGRGRRLPEERLASVIVTITERHEH